MVGLSLRSVTISLPVVAGFLSLVAYLPFLNLPPLPDDYLQIELSQRYGTPEGWINLAADPLYRSRSTSLVVSYVTLAVAGFSPWLLNATSICFHVLNTLLIFTLGASPLIGRRVAAIAAVVFAVRERHHEAVIWYAALPELLIFTFSILTLACWIRWLKTDGEKPAWLVPTLAALALALLSKESAVAIVPLMAVMSWPYRKRIGLRRLSLTIAPFAMLAALDAALIFGGASQNQHFGDGTFAFTSSFPLAFWKSAVRGFWIWASLSTLAILWWRSRLGWRVLATALAWILICLAPYSFVTYMPRIPSRHHYLASVGFALLIAAAMVTVKRVSGSRWLAHALAIVMVLHNVGYLWLVKRDQFFLRAEPIESILRLAKDDARRPLRIRCVTISIDEVRRALKIRGGESDDSLVMDSTAGHSFCSTPSPSRAQPDSGNLDPH